MPRMLDREDDKFFYYTDGGKTAKSQLTPGKREAMSAEIEKNRLAQVTAGLTGQSKADLQNAQTEFRDISAEFRNQPPQMSLAPTQNVLGVPVNAPSLGQAPIIQNPMAQPAGTMDMTPYNAPIPKTVVTTESVSGVPFSKEQQTALIKSLDRQIKATEDFAKAQGQAQVELAKINEDTQRSLDMIAYDRSLIEEKRQQAINVFNTKYQETIDQLQSAKVDPERFYGGSVGKRVLAGISIALGSFGSALTGQRNYALDIINKAIDDDIAAQREGIQKLGAQASLQRQFMQDIRQRFQDEDQAQLAQKAALIETAQMKIRQITDRVSNEQQKMAGEQLIGQLEAQKIDALSKGQQLAAGKVVTRTQQEFGGSGIDPEVYKQIREQRKDWVNDPVTQKTRAIRNSVAQVNSMLTLKTGPADLAAIIMLAKTLDPPSVVREGEVETIRKTGGAADWLIGYYNKAKGEGMLSDNLRKQMKEQADIHLKTQNKLQEKTNKFYLRGLPAGVDPRMIIEEEDQPEIDEEEDQPEIEIPSTLKISAPQRQIMKGR